MVVELGFVAAPMIGTVVGVRRHAAFGVGAALGGVIGAASGVATDFAVGFLLAAALSLLTDKPMFTSKPERTADDS